MSELTDAQQYQDFRPRSPVIRSALKDIHCKETIYLKTDSTHMSSVLCEVCDYCRLIYPCPTVGFIDYVCELEQLRVEDFDEIKKEIARIEEGNL